MAHSEHNRSKKKNSGFLLIIFGALLLFLAPNVYPNNPETGVAASVSYTHLTLPTILLV